MNPKDDYVWLDAQTGPHLAATREVLFDISRDLLGSASPSGYFTALNPAWETALGFSIAALMDRPFVDFVHPGDRKVTQSELAKLFLQGEESVDFENRYAMAGGGWRYLSWQANVREDRVYFVAHDITDRIIRATRSRQASDFVRGIDDAIFTLTPEGLIRSWNRKCEAVYGFPADEAVGRRIKDLIVPEGRWLETDDGLAKLLEGVGVSQIITERRTKSGNPVRVAQTASLIRGTDGEVREVAVVSRDVSGLSLNDPVVTHELDIVAWAALVRDAVDRGRVIFYAQPVLDLHGGPVSYELLCRLTGLDGQIMLPREFMPAAERHGLLEDLDLFGVKAAAKFIAEGHRASINISTGSIRRKNFVEAIVEELRLTGASPSNLTIEISETALMHDQASGLRFVDELATRGIGVALDDFGTGVGGFTNLSRLPIQNLKIDVGFIRRLYASEASQHVVKAVVSLAKAFDMVTIAEGVEDAATADLLRGFGVDQAQGNYFAEPRPIKDVIGDPIRIHRAA